MFLIKRQNAIHLARTVKNYFDTKFKANRGTLIICCYVVAAAVWSEDRWKPVYYLCQNIRVQNIGLVSSTVKFDVGNVKKLKSSVDKVRL